MKTLEPDSYKFPSRDEQPLTTPPNVEPVDLKPRKLEDISRDIAGSFFEYPTPSFYRLDAEVLNALEKAVIRSTSPLQAEIERMELVAASRDAEKEKLLETIRDLRFQLATADVDKEQARWQEAIYDALCDTVKENALGINVDGAGSDSGDPMDFTLTEICQVNNAFSEKLTALQQVAASNEVEIEQAVKAAQDAINERDNARTQLTAANQEIEQLKAALAAKGEK